MNIQKITDSVNNYISYYNSSNNYVVLKLIQQDLENAFKSISSQTPSVRDIKRTLYVLEKTQNLQSSKEDITPIQNLADTITILCLNILDHPRCHQIPEQTFEFLFSCDFSDDFNGAIWSTFFTSFKEKIPIITTSSLVSMSDLEDRNKRLQRSLEFKKMLETEFNNWDIYREIEGDFILFFPKERNYTLEKVDLKPEKFEKVDKIPDLFKGPCKKSDINDFINLFNQTTYSRKRIILDGHGNDGTIGALPTKDYQKFLSFLENSQTDYLEVHSCRGGGINLLNHYFIDAEKEKKPSFPIIVRSIGSFPTNYNEKESLNKGFRAFEYFHKSGFSDLREFQKAALEQNPKDYIQNFPQIQQPTYGIENPPLGFRPLFLQKNFILTYHRLRSLQINEKIPTLKNPHPNSKSMQPVIEVKNAEAFEIFPLVVPIPIKITQHVPAIYSKVPGNSHHFLEELTLESNLTLIDSTREKFKKTESHHAFFIKKRIQKLDWLPAGCSGLEIYREVLSFSEEAIYFLATEKKGQNFKLLCCDHEGKNIKLSLLSAHEYALIAFQIAFLTIPNQKSVHLSSGGQDNDDCFWEALFESFWTEDFFDKEIIESLKILKKAVISELECYQIVENFLKHLHSLFEVALTLNKKELANYIFINYPKSIKINQKDFRGDTLLNKAIRNRNTLIVKFLLENGADVNLRGLANKPPLVSAILSGKSKVIEFLLEQDNLEMEAKTPRGWTALSLCNDQTISKALLAKGANINHITNNGWTALSYAVFERNKKRIKELIQLSADPNAGKPSALIKAIHLRDEEMVSFLLDEKIADPSKADQDGNYPIIEAACCGTPNILKRLLQEPAVNIHVTNKNGENALLLAEKYDHFMNKEILLAASTQENLFRG